MQKSLFLSLLWLFPAIAILSTTESQAQTPTVTTLARLGGTTDGYHAEAAPVLGSDGNLYGTTEAGGLANCGTIYQLTPAGTLTTLYSFTGGTDGSNPVASLVLGPDGNFYGTTPVPGAVNPSPGEAVGTVFKVTPAGALTTIYTFSALDGQLQNTDGANPRAALTLGSDGNFYGTTTAGGSNGGGTVFRITPVGGLTVLYNFAAGEIDTAVQAGLTLGNDGNFYGVAPGGANGGGLIFQLTPAGAFTIIYTFPDDANGYTYEPNALTKGSDGAFYGTTRNGGTGSVGTAFRVTTAGAFTTLHNFSDTVDGQYPTGALVLGSDGNFYGTTSDGGPSGSDIDGYGTVFQMTPGGAVTVLHIFTYTEYQGTLAGANPAGLVQGSDGALYGAAAYGNIGDTVQDQTGPGTLFRITTDGSFSTLAAFVNGGYNCNAPLAEVNGYFFGTTLQGGAYGGGNVFAVARDGSQASVHDFNPATEGDGSATGIVVDADGNLFGANVRGGPDGGGTLFQLVPQSSTDMRRVATRSAGTSAQPMSLIDNLFAYTYLAAIFGDSAALGAIHAIFIDAPLSPTPNPGTEAEQSITAGTVKAQSADTDVFYGVSLQGGNNNGQGVIFSYTTGGTAFTYPYSFGTQPNDGIRPIGLVRGSEGNFYGATEDGGLYGNGTIFKYTPGGTLTTLYAFQGNGDGANPMAGVVLGSDGNLYGTTSANSASDDSGGTLFRLATDGSGFTVLHTFANDTDYSSTDGDSPAAPLLSASDGKLYGTTSLGGSDSGGTVFSFDPASGTYTSIYSFTGANGGGTGPSAALIQSSDGNLYGTTTYGGTDNAGVLFEVSLAPLPSSFFTGEVALGNGVYYLAFPDGDYFGYYSYLSDPRYLYHFDLGYEYVFDANDGHSGVYLYDFKSSDFFYTSPVFPFPYLYDFGLNTVLYYYPDPHNAGHYNTDGIRYFYDFSTGKIITK